MFSSFFSSLLEFCFLSGCNKDVLFNLSVSSLTESGLYKHDIRAFGIARDWKATSLEAEVWIETATEGGRRFMAVWKK